MDRRRIIIISIFVLIIAVVIFLIWWFWPRPEPEPVVTAEPKILDLELERQLKNLPPETQEVVEVEPEYLNLRQVAFAFAERYGSYSSDLPFKNFEDLKSEMTPNMIAKTEQLKAEKARQTTDGYYGQEIRAMTGDITSYTETSATIMVNTQRAQYIGNSQTPIINYIKIEIQLVKDGQQWKVDNADWQTN